MGKVQLPIKNTTLQALQDICIRSDGFCKRCTKEQQYLCEQLYTEPPSGWELLPNEIKSNTHDTDNITTLSYKNHRAVCNKCKHQFPIIQNQKYCPICGRRIQQQ